MCSVPNAFVCIEVKVIIRILSFTRFFKHTAIILNTTVCSVAQDFRKVREAFFYNLLLDFCSHMFAKCLILTTDLF